MRYASCVALIVATALCSHANAQCVNNRCYRPLFSASSVPASGKVLRTRSQLPDGSWGPWTSVGSAAKSTVRASVRSTGLMPGEINRDSRAYDHAKREAQMLANSGNGAWHPLGVCTQAGCRYSGCGMSMNGQPNHCFLRSIPESRIVARACVQRGGRWYWSAHYR